MPDAVKPIALIAADGRLASVTGFIDYFAQ